VHVHLFSANFQIYQLGEQVMTIDNGFGKTYQLCFSHGNHYDIVYPEVCQPSLILFLFNVRALLLTRAVLSSSS
jgi:hypothetical protein